MADSTEMTRTFVGQWLSELVANTKSGIPLVKMFKLYQEDFGEHFPMRQLGCLNPIKALESLSDYVSLEVKPETGEKMIMPVVAQTKQIVNEKRELTKHEVNEDLQQPTVLKPHRGTYQLTFMNHFQLEKSVLLDYFQHQAGFCGSNILGGLKRRCFVSFKTEKDALEALETLKGNESLLELDVADDCKLSNYDIYQEQMEVEIPEIFACRGTFQLSFTTPK